MKRLKVTVVLAMLAFATFLPGASMGVSAQGVDLCAGALENGEGSYAGYTVVYGSGGSGNQIVLGSLDGNDYLSGGSGNDVLCAWGNANTLDGGSGSDVLIAVDGENNVLLGGSGNDTLMGSSNNTFDGGSGRNEIVEQEPMQGPRIVVTAGPVDYEQITYCVIQVELIDFDTDTDYQVITTLHQIGEGLPLMFQTDEHGYALGVGTLWSGGSDSDTVDVSAGGLSTTLVFENCSTLPPLDISGL